MGYLFVVVALLLLVPIVLLVSRRSRAAADGEKPVGKPVMVTQPAADEPTPDASRMQKNTDTAQRHTPAA